MRYLIKNVNIFDGSGSALAEGSVLTDGERISQVLTAACTSPSNGVRVIDGEGGTLMPGMVEAHAHLSWPSSIEKIYHEFVLPPLEMRAATWRNARILLDAGFTSAYSAGSLGDSLEPMLRDEISAGRTPGPRLKASTIERSPDGEGFVDKTHMHGGRGPQAMRDFVDHCQEICVDSLKLVISGEDQLKPGTSKDLLYTEAEVRAVCDAAQAKGIWVNAHTYTPEAIRIAINSGVRVVYHCSWADEATLDLMCEQKDTIFTGPAVGVLVGVLEAAPPPHFDMNFMKESAQQVLNLDVQLVPKMRQRGIRVLIGGDYGFPFNPNGTNARDLQHFVKYFGYSPTDALVAATKLGGEIMGMGDSLGLIKAGYLADMLLIDGDPTQDVSIMQDRSRIKMIMQGGRLHKAPVQSTAALAH